MTKGACGWAGCGNRAEGSLDGLRLCRSHFYDIATSRLKEHRTRLSKGDPVGPERTRILDFVSLLISETTLLVASAKFLGQEHRDMYLELTLSATELYKRVQRSPRIPRNMPILIYRETDSKDDRELTNTLDVSKEGACIATRRAWEKGEKIWIEKPTNQSRTLARVAWVKKSEPSDFLIGLEILDYEDFWALEAHSRTKKR